MRNRIENVGILSALCGIATALSMLVGCSSGGDGGVLLAAEVDTKSGTTIATVAAVQDKTTLIDTATVTVNGTTVPFFLVAYIGGVPLIGAGANVTLHFVYKDIDIQKALTMPDVPNITSPLPGATFTPGNTVPLTWDAPPSGTWDNIVVSISGTYTVSSDEYTAILPANATGHIIPGNVLDSPQSAVTVIVEAMNSTTNLGSVRAGSFYQVANQDSVSIRYQ